MPCVKDTSYVKWLALKFCYLPSITDNFLAVYLHFMLNFCRLPLPPLPSFFLMHITKQKLYMNTENGVHLCIYQNFK